MKLASLKNGSRDGVLVVVSRDLRHAVAVPEIAATLQQAIESWDTAAPRLIKVYDALNALKAPAAFPFDDTQAESPLPRAYQWLDASAYMSHVELVRKARGAAMPEGFADNPIMYQGDSEYFTGPRDPVLIATEEWGADLEAEVAAITGNVPMQSDTETAAGQIKLLMLVNDISLRNIIPAELNKGFGFVNGKGVTAFSPVAVTPDELGDAWDGAKVNLPLTVHINGSMLGEPLAGKDMYFDFPVLIAHAAKTRPLGAGTIVGSGTVSNHDRSRGFCCISEARASEVVANGAARTPFFRFGDRVRIEMLDAGGNSIFGAIDQEIQRYMQ